MKKFFLGHSSPSSSSTCYITSVRTNVSNNPFAYLKDDTDIDIFITNMTNDYSDDELTKPVLQLLFIAVKYIFCYCSASDHNIEAISKFLNSLVGSNMRDSLKNPSYMFSYFCSYIPDDERGLSLRRKISAFRRQFYESDDLNFYDVVSSCICIINNLDPIKCLNHLNDKEQVLQAEIKTSDGYIYDFWFYKSYSSYDAISELKFELINHDKTERKISAFVFSIYPFLHHFGGQDLLNHDYLNHVISMCKKQFFKETKISDSVKNKFTDNSNNDLSSLIFKGLNIGYNELQSKSLYIHESAHAVMHYLCGHEILSIEFDLNEFNGCVHAGTSLQNPFLQTDYFTEIITLYSGYIASREFCPEEYFSWCSDECSSDVSKATYFARDYIMQTSKGFDPRLLDFDSFGISRSFWLVHESILLCDKLYKQTEALVRNHKNLILSLSDHIFGRETIPGEEVFEFLRSIDASLEGSMISLLNSFSEEG